MKNSLCLLLIEITLQGSAAKKVWETLLYCKCFKCFYDKFYLKIIYKNLHQGKMSSSNLMKRKPETEYKETMKKARLDIIQQKIGG